MQSEGDAWTDVAVGRLGLGPSGVAVRGSSPPSRTSSRPPRPESWPQGGACTPSCPRAKWAVPPGSARPPPCLSLTVRPYCVLGRSAVCTCPRRPLPCASLAVDRWVSTLPAVRVRGR